jgi:periplasmic protein TonB
MEKSIFNNWETLVAPVRNDIVFEHKNKDYGAYQLRKNQNRTIAFALFISSSIFVLMISIPAIIGMIKNPTEIMLPDIDISGLIEITPPNAVEVPLTALPAIKNPVESAQIKFTQLIATDKDVTVDPLPIQGSKETTPIGTETNIGNTDQQFNIRAAAIGEENKIHSLIEIEENPEFPGGYAAMNKWLMSNLTYPQIESDAQITGTVHVEFVVNKEGEISELKLLKGVSGGPGLEKEALRVLKLMPKWKPGRMNGKPVNVRYHIPIRFSKS